jgi:hypothetical protein
MLYALFFKSDVYHYVKPSDDNQNFDKTYCNTPLVIKRDQNSLNQHNSGYPAPRIRKSPPPKKRLCKYCHQIRSNISKHENNAQPDFIAHSHK